MNCKETGKALQAYLDAELDDLTARRVAAHLETCRRCGLELADYTEIKAALARYTVDRDDLALRRLRAFVDDLAAGRFDRHDERWEPGAPA